MEECIFCKIIKHEIPAKVVNENEYVIAFEDAYPVAPVHVLIVPKKHIANIMEVNDENMVYINEIHKMIQNVAKNKKIDAQENGFRVITNYGEDGGQTVHHLHYHVIGGKRLGPKIIHE
ncbi:MAG: HIT domain-containing protein [Clostridia bacterium]|nr:HIT domain-containing protein [Clostridia bacterium]